MSWWEQHRDTSITILPLLVQIIWTFTTLTIIVHCVLVNTLQYHDTVDLVQDAETEDPHRDKERQRKKMEEKMKEKMKDKIKGSRENEERFR